MASARGAVQGEEEAGKGLSWESERWETRGAGEAAESRCGNGGWGPSHTRPVPLGR